jgi:hypothetical protein
MRRHRILFRFGENENVTEVRERFAILLTVILGPYDHRRLVIRHGHVSGSKLVTAAKAAGLADCGIPTLLVQVDNKSGLGHAIAQALAGARMNVAFLVA